MTRRAVDHGGMHYVIADGDAAQADLLPHAVLQTRVVDELTLAPPVAPVRLTSTLRRARARVGDGGVCGLVARPRDVAAALVTPQGFTAEVRAPGYLPRDLTPAIELARRTLNSPAAGSVLDILPGDPARAQFAPGRGVMIERPPAPDLAEQFTAVAATATPPLATDVPLRDPVMPPRPAGARIAGVPMFLPDQPLHRDTTVRIRGRIQVRTAASTLAPAIGADSGILGVWWNYPSSMTGTPMPPDLCAVDPPLRFPHAAGASVHTCVLNPVGTPQTLGGYAPASARQLLIAPNGALNPLGGDVLRIGDPITRDDEIVVTDGFEPLADPAVPVRVRLRMATGLMHRGGDPVHVVQPASVTAIGALTREALPGDRVLFATGVTGLSTISTIIVGHLTPFASFHRATQLPWTPDGVAFSHVVLPDGTGRFTWPPLARVAQVRVVARLAPHTPVQLDVALDYAGETNLAIVLT